MISSGIGVIICGFVLGISVYLANAIQVKKKSSFKKELTGKN